MTANLPVTVIEVIESTLNHVFALLVLCAVKGNGCHQRAANGAPFEEADELSYQMRTHGLELMFVL